MTEDGITEADLGKFPKIIGEIYDECRTSYRCPACSATKRANVHYDPDWEDAETVVIIECRPCGNEETRYYPG